MILLKINIENGLETHRISSFPCKIGRAIDNDIVISDSSVSVYHASLDRDAEGFYIEDLSSTNGIMRDNKRETKIHIKQPVKIKLGDVGLELRSTDEIHEDTAIVNLADLKIEPEHKPESKYRDAILCVFILCANILLLYMNINYLEPSLKKSELGTQITYIIIGSLAIAFPLLIWSKLQIQKYNFFKVLNIVLIANIMASLLSELSDFFEFNFSIGWLWTPVYIIATLYLTFDLIAKVIYPKTLRKKRTAIIVSMLIAGSIFVYKIPTLGQDELITAIENNDFNMEISYPIQKYKNETHNLDNLFKKIDKIETQLASHRLKLEKKKSDIEAD